MYLHPHWGHIWSEKYILCRHNSIHIGLFISRNLNLFYSLSHRKIKYSKFLIWGFFCEVINCALDCLLSFHPLPRFCSHSAVYEICVLEVFCYSHCACSYNQYVYHPTIGLSNTTYMICIISYMFRLQGAIFRDLLQQRCRSQLANIYWPLAVESKG